MKFDFSEIVAKEEKVKFPGGVTCTIREASGAAVSKWKSAQLDGLEMGQNGKPSSLGLRAGELPLILVSGCLYDDAGTTLMGRQFVEKIPDSQLSQLNSWVMEVSGLGVKVSDTDDEDTEPKN